MRAFLLLILLFFASSGPVWACSGSCTSDAECAANPCRYCDTDFNVCTDCCEFTEQSICAQPTCTWESGECRNISGISCGVPVPETQRSYRWIFFLAVFLGGLAIAWKWRLGKLVKPR